MNNEALNREVSKIQAVEVTNIRKGRMLNTDKYNKLDSNTYSRDGKAGNLSEKRKKTRH